ncbi:MAG: hypothetical protein V3V08_17075 [Nannocystaceae bacterium]
MLRWASRAFEIDTDPVEIDNDWGPLTAGALQRYRTWYEATLGLVPPEAEKPDRQDWLAVAASYDAAVCRALEWSPEELASARDGIKWHGDPPVLAGGEAWPAQSPGTGSAAENRRVEVLFALPEDYPDDLGEPPGATIYDNPRYRRIWLDADELWLALGTAVRNDVHVRLLSNSGRHHLGSCECDVESPSGPLKTTTDEEGRLKLTSVAPGYHALKVQFDGEEYETLVPSVAAGTGPYLHRVAGAVLREG